MSKFVKGQSGNPGGRPKQTAKLSELARTYTKEAMRTLVQIMKSKKVPAAARVNAACALLDRGYGRPAQSIDLTNSDGSLSQQWRDAMKAVDEDIQEASVSH
jgi:phage gp46-like protein